MAFDPNTQERIYRALKEEYLRGAFVPGARFDIQGLADRYRASATPVREAMHRMIGEQLLEGHPEGGIRVVRPEAAQLSELYLWNAQLLLATLRFANANSLRTKLRPFSVRAAKGSTGQVGLLADLFLAIAEATGVREFAGQVARTNERLHYARIAELRLFGDLNREFSTFLRNGTIDVRSNLRRRIIAYHRRRIEHADEISAAMGMPGKP